MCFSAEASFIASAGLCVLGVASIRKAKSPELVPFAAIPFLFGAQQFVEGIVWMSLNHEGWRPFTDPASTVFLLIAQVLWPIWMPYAFLRLEPDPARKKIIRLLMWPGCIVAGYFLYGLITFGRETVANNHHVFYKIDFPVPLIPVAAGCYLIATVLPPLLSRSMFVKLIGIILLGSYVIARLFFQPALISVWCFFAIVVSVVIYLELRRAQPTPILKEA